MHRRFVFVQKLLVIFSRISSALNYDLKSFVHTSILTVNALR